MMDCKKVKIGKVAIRLRGEWSKTPDNPYMKLDAVSRNGNSYVSKYDNNNEIPENSNKWMVLALRGEKGERLKLEELTPDELAILQKPASDAANSLSSLGKKLECMIEKSEDAINEIDSFQERLSNLENEIFPYTLEITGVGIFEKGTSQTVVLEWILKKGDNIITPESSSVNGTPVSGNTKTFKGITSDTEFTVSVIYSGKEFLKTVNAEFISPIYIGFSPSENSNSLNIKSLEKLSVRKNPYGNYSLNNDTTGNYLWICVPSSMRINEITSSGFIVPMNDFQEGATDVDSYKCYRSFSQINKGTMNITIE